jgi:diacylglycerol kinase family enzyme
VSSSGYLVVANAEAGSAERSAVGEAVVVLAANGPVEVAWTATPDDIDRVAAGLGSRLLVVAGGDGTIHLVANRLRLARYLDVPVGIVPLGTGNDFARGLDLPLEPGPAAQRIVDGRPRTVPVVRLSTGEIAVNNAHLGVGVEAASRGQSLKGRLGRMAYGAGALMAGLSHECRPAVVEVDGETVHDGPALLVIVALGPSAGGGYRLDDELDLRDTGLDVVIVDDLRRSERLLLLGKLAASRLTDASPVRRHRGSSVAITPVDRSTAEVDGEFRTWSGRVTFDIDTSGWTVVC